MLVKLADERAIARRIAFFLVPHTRGRSSKVNAGPGATEVTT